MSAISSQTSEALRQAHALVERDQALSALVTALDPGRSMSLWALSGTITRMMTTHDTALDRIARGHRLPQNDIERTLLVLRVSDLPRSHRRLFSLLQDLLGD